MKPLGGVFLALLMSAGAFSQTVTRSFGSVVFPGGTSATSPNISRNFGSVVFPGSTPTAAPVRAGSPPIAPAPAFNGRPGVTNSFTGAGGQRRPFGNRGGGGRIAPATVYAYPVYVGGYGNYYDSAAPGPEGPIAPPQAQPQPQPEVRPIIIELRHDGQYTTSRQAAPEPEPAAAPEPEAPNYLIAFKDHTIYSTPAYWFDGDTLHYFTAGNTHNQASVSLIDRELTERLNREMGIDFKMPK
jgi:hypothetical protein